MAPFENEDIVRLNPRSSSNLSQQWRLVPFAGGWHRIENRVAKVLDARAEDVELNVCKVQMWEIVEKNRNQLWRISPLADGRVKIECGANPGKVLDAHAPTADKPGCFVQIWPDLGPRQINQTWIIEPAEPGFVVIQCGMGKLVLDAGL